MSNYSPEDVLIYGAYRTPIGDLNGSLATLKAHELGSVVIQKLLETTGLPAENVSEVILGQVFTAGQGMNPARQAAVKAGIPYSVPAHTLSFVCGSGLKTVANAYQSIKCGDNSVVIAGGQESMTNAPHCVGMRSGLKFGNGTLTDIMLNDGLTDAFHGYLMGITAENVAKQWNISREEQDKFAANSQQKIGKSLEENAFAGEIVPVEVKQRRETVTVTEDQSPKVNTTSETLSKLRPAFIKDGSGTVTAGNSSIINDGAACVLLSTLDEAQRLNVKEEPLARIVSWAQVGVDPSIMGVAPVGAVQKAVAKAGWTLDEVDLVELNEAFASQSIAVVKELNVPMEKVNVCGGSIGLGHPIGCSGCRILVTLLHAMKRINKRKGVAALCIGGGMGIALCVERLN